MARPNRLAWGRKSRLLKLTLLQPRGRCAPPNTAPREPRGADRNRIGDRNRLEAQMCERPRRELGPRALKGVPGTNRPGTKMMGTRRSRCKALQCYDEHR